MVSLRDFMRNDERRPQMTSPARSVRADATLAEAARVLAEESLHHVVVIDATGRAVGMLSVLDVLRAVVGLPAAPLRRPFAESEAERAANPSADDESCGIRIP